MTFNVADIINQAAATTNENMNEAAPSGQRENIVAGVRLMRFVGYYELGIREFSGKDKNSGKQYKTKKNMARLIFELCGPNDEPREINGELTPNRVKIDVNLARSERSIGFKLFGLMNYKGDAKIFPQLLGRVFIGEVHLNVVGEGDEQRTYANLRDKDGNLTIQPPLEKNARAGTVVDISDECRPAVTPLGVFLWDHASKAMWDAIYIPGTFGEGGPSRNVFQEEIKKAVNFAEIADIVAGGDALALGLEDAEKPQRSEQDVQASADRSSLVSQGVASSVTGAAGVDPLAGM